MPPRPLALAALAAPAYAQTGPSYPRFNDGVAAAPARFADACRAAGLPAIPTDPFNGKPLQYAVNGGEPTVSSVGKDERGTPLAYRLPTVAR